MQPYKRVLVVCDYKYAVGRACVNGAVACVTESGTTELHLSSPEDGFPALDMDIDGVLFAPPYTPQVFRRAQQLNIPLVQVADLDTVPKDAQYSYFYPDEQSVGKLAADHFIERGFKSFAYCGLPGNSANKARRDGFIHALHAAHFDCMVFSAEKQIRLKQFKKFALQLPEPIAVLAFNDTIALNLSYALHQDGLTCPSDVALMGVDNDELICSMGVPSLTSIDINWAELGYRAMQHLDTLIRGGAPRLICTVQPKGVVLRASTDCLVIPDPKVVQALCFIRQHASIPFSTEDVLAEVQLSRPNLDNRFTRFLGHTIATEIMQTRLTRAKKMLTETDENIETIAHACGFNYADHLFRLLKRQTGMTPRQYRMSTIQAKDPNA